MLNYALQPMTDDAFDAIVTEGQPAAPGYFVYDAIKNRKDRALLDEERPADALTLLELDAAVRRWCPRARYPPRGDFAAAHLVGSLNVGLARPVRRVPGATRLARHRDMRFAASRGEAEAVIHLGRIGFDNVIGLASPLPVMVSNPRARRNDISG